MRSRGVSYRGVGTGGGTQAGISEKDSENIDTETERMLAFNTRAALEGRTRCRGCHGVGKIAGSTCGTCKGHGWEPTPAELRARERAEARARAEAKARRQAEAEAQAEAEFPSAPTEL